MKYNTKFAKSNYSEDFDAAKKINKSFKKDKMKRMKGATKNLNRFIDRFDD